MPRVSKISIRVWTEHFLGTEQKCLDLLSILESMDNGKWMPEKWCDYEPVRWIYDPRNKAALVSKWTTQRRDRFTNDLLFRKKKPYLEAMASCWRWNSPRLNGIDLYLDARAFASDGGAERLKVIALAFVDWSQAVYATVRHPDQMHSRTVSRTPLERLERLDWLTFFGRPYLDIFGGEECVLAAPCYSAEQVSGGILLIATPKPDSPEMTESAETLIALEDYLGTDAFAGQGYPEIPCHVPNFDLSETVNAKL
jgi:hypothetical protein